MYEFTMLLATIALVIIFRSVGRDLYKERESLGAGAKSLATGGLYLAALLAGLIILITAALLVWKFLLFVW